MNLQGVARFMRLLTGIALVTAAGALLVGTLIRQAPLRSVSVGFYGVGALLVVVGFFHCTRGLMRAADEGPFRRSELHWVTAEEHRDSLASSALFVVVGAALLVLGTLLDRRYPLA